MEENKGFDDSQIKEVLINTLVFTVQAVIFYAVEHNKLFIALSTMALLFSMYSIPLSKSDVKSTIIGSISVNILMSIFFIAYYYNNFNLYFLIIWVLISLWFMYKLIEKFKIK